MNKKDLVNLYKTLTKKVRAYGLAFSVLGFDNSTIAPKKSLDEKAELEGILAMEYYNIVTSSEYDNAVNGLFEIKDSLTNDLKREIELAKKQLDHIQKIPSELYQELTVLRSKAYIAWLEAKEKSDYSLFAPSLKRLIEINKECAKIYGSIDGSLYNTWLNEYEEGMNTQILDQFFKTIRERIVPLLRKVQSSNIYIDDEFTKSKVSHDKQMEITKYILGKIGFDFSRGVIAETEHPFMSAISPNDVRITTHIYENMFFSNIFSTVHEGGHALYEQNLASSLNGTELRSGTSMAFHESQSRFYENIIGRSEQFIEQIYKKVVSKLSGTYKKTVTKEQMYLAANKVEPGLIRIEADELTYSLHVMVRYEIEKRMFEEDLDVNNLPALWNELYKEYLGLEVPNDSLGILQDSHWSSGYFGYFPSYALGNAYGVQMLRMIEKEFDIYEAIKNNKIKKINKWFKDHVYIYGLRITPNELIMRVTGEGLNPEYYCEYLENKFSKIYKLN